jgi:hypothetical protein
MGYTHYWKAGRRATKSEIAKVLPITRDILERHKEHILMSESEITDKGKIRINDASGEGYETFYVDLSYLPESRGFCKTGRMPYDQAVCEMLLVLAAKIPAFKINSDGLDRECRYYGSETGFEESWPAAMKAVKKLYGLNYAGGYRDLGNILRFVLEIDGRSILEKMSSDNPRPGGVRRVREMCPSY